MMLSQGTKLATIVLIIIALINYNSQADVNLWGDESR